MKIKLPNELREEVERVRAGMNPNLPAQQVASLPDNYLATPADLLGKVLDFYLAACDRCYADLNEEFYRDWPLAMEAGRKTPAYQQVLMLRIMVYKKQKERATAGNIQLFYGLFEKALNGQINLNDPT
jgi:hypothetical protein